MQRWIALLRGINVGGRNKLPMKTLTEVLHACGCRNVHTYIQSGNAVFVHAAVDALDLADRIRNRIEEQLGFAPRTFLLNLKTLSAAIAGNPFPEAAAEPTSLHLFFLDGQPDRLALAELGKLQGDTEKLVLDGRLLYLSAPGGIGRSRLAKGVERALGTTATARNWRTVLKLEELGAGL